MLWIRTTNKYCRAHQAESGDSQHLSRLECQRKGGDVLIKQPVCQRHRQGKESGGRLEGAGHGWHVRRKRWRTFYRSQANRQPLRPRRGLLRCRQREGGDEAREEAYVGPAACLAHPTMGAAWVCLPLFRLAVPALSVCFESRDRPGRGCSRQRLGTIAQAQQAGRLILTPAAAQALNDRHRHSRARKGCSSQPLYRKREGRNRAGAGQEPGWQEEQATTT